MAELERAEGKKRGNFSSREINTEIWKQEGQQTDQALGLMGLQVPGASKGFQPQPFPVPHHPFCYTPHVSGWKTHPHMQYHIQACNSRKSVAHQGKSLLV